MNKKGVESMLGMFIVTTLLIIVGLVLFQGTSVLIGNSVGQTVYTRHNQTITVPADGASVDLGGQELVGTPEVLNATGWDNLISDANYTIQEAIKTTGTKGVTYTAVGSEYEGETLNVTYQYYDDGYIDNSGGRAMARLILIFFALAIVVVAMSPVLKDQLLKNIK